MPHKDPAVRRAYQREYQRKWYAQNRDKHIARTRRVADARRGEVRETLWMLKSQPCMDCGQIFDPVCMDFDHRDAKTKFANVSAMARKDFPWERIEAEIAKCDLVCSNCHRLRTKARRTDAV